MHIGRMQYRIIGTDADGADTYIKSCNGLGYAINEARRVLRDGIVFFVQDGINEYKPANVRVEDTAEHAGDNVVFTA